MAYSLVKTRSAHNENETAIKEKLFHKSNEQFCNSRYLFHYLASRKEQTVYNVCQTHVLLNRYYNMMKSHVICKLWVGSRVHYTQDKTDLSMVGCCVAGGA